MPVVETLETPKGSYEICRVLGTKTDDFKEVSKCFVDSFWYGSTTFEKAISLNDKQIQNLIAHHARDAAQLYRSRFQSSLFAARDDTGEIVGLVGVVAAFIDLKTGKVLVNEEAENLLPESALAEYRRMPPADRAKFFFPQYTVLAYLSNLAVAPSTRRTGLAKELCKLCDRTAKSWGMDAIMMVVEQANGPARQLYENLGYQTVLELNEAKGLRLFPGSDLLQEVPAPSVMLGKPLE